MPPLECPSDIEIEEEVVHGQSLVGLGTLHAQDEYEQNEVCDKEMDEEERNVDIMSVKLAIQRELAYREKVASYFSEEEISELLPLEVRTLRLYTFSYFVFVSIPVSSE
ncbi:hypothetical protein ACH5RR_000594 [Cinchona calisaya]|uniref:Uncharacterized protein n=1 Tax=Cinchona calisaya TaxID=153742 RepID=A0ABD3B1T4_9GENT